MRAATNAGCVVTFRIRNKHCSQIALFYLFHTAIDLVDEACAKLKNEITSKPVMLDEIDRRIIQLEMERLSLQSDFENDKEENKMKMAADESARLGRLDQELEDLKKQQEELNLRWMAEKGGVTRIKDLKEQIAELKVQIENCEVG